MPNTITELQAALATELAALHTEIDQLTRLVTRLENVTRNETAAA